MLLYITVNFNIYEHFISILLTLVNAMWTNKINSWSMFVQLTLTKMNKYSNKWIAHGYFMLVKLTNYGKPF